eukprot:1875162-Pyramimonas_sp.AAC.1
MGRSNKKALPSRIEGVAISAAAEGRKAGGSETRPPPPAEAGGRAAEGGGSERCTPKRWKQFWGQ